TTPRNLDPQPNHYETLSLEPTATPSDIKRQFFTLSKRHHPDKNPDDPTASTRFVQISEAYHVLSIPEKRAQYDRQIQQSSGASRWGGDGGIGKYPQGSYSSASYAGSRPATGLNKKRSTFRGPPPSFYNSGGYGQHSAKRGEYAHHQHPHTNTKSHPGTAEGETRPESESYGGFGPGQTDQGSEVPHFDDRRHRLTHDHVNEHIHARRRNRRRDEIPDDIDRGGTLINFLLVSGAVGMIGLSAKLMSDKNERNPKKRDS
ncbi:DnaJ-domain-containing protein, partial [Pleomassaria siparia CBS 279.74]